VVNASLEFNVQTLQPTYKLTLGLPGRSNALAIAQRLGLPGNIIKAARAEINPDDLRADKLIGDIHRQRKIAFRESEKAERARSEARHLERDLAARLEKIEQERQQVLEAAHAEGQLEVEVLKAQLDTLKVELKKARQPLDALQAIEQEVELVEEKILAPVKRKQTAEKSGPPTIANRPLSIGEKVILRNLGTEGVVTALDDQEAEIQAGSLRLRVPLDELKRKQASPEEEPAQPVKKRPSNSQSSISNQKSSLHLAPSPGLEVDLRGLNSEEALDKLETYLDKAYLAGMPFVRIIHGKGTGKLRQVVREALRGHPQIKSFEEGGDKEGGEGVTVAKLAG
jgi:DNA mismatch repair protein MutS2